MFRNPEFELRNAVFQKVFHKKNKPKFYVIFK